jgi:hypothetical protein
LTIEEITRHAAGLCGLELQPGLEGRMDYRYKRLESAVIHAQYEAARVLRRKRKESIIPVNGLIPYNRFSLGVVDVVSVRSGGIPVAWSETEDGIDTAQDAECEVEYVACPLRVTYQDSPLIPDGFFSHKNYAYYAASEYLSSQGRHTDARVFDIRWRRALHANRGRLRMPFGRWL